MPPLTASTAPPARALTCPRCGDEPLAALPADGALIIDFCGRCKGTWCDRGEFETLLGIAPDNERVAAARRSATLTSLHCPVCRREPLGRLRFGPDDDLHAERCARCGGAWLDGGVVPKLKAHFASEISARRPITTRAPAAPREDESFFNRARALFTARELDTDEEEEITPPGRIPYDLPVVNAAAVPIAFVAALLVNASGLQSLVEFVFVNMWFHEFGHATMAWLTGRSAMPLPFVTFTASEDRSVAFALLFAFCLVACGVYGFRRGRRRLVGFAAIGLILQGIFTLGISSAKSNELIVFAGCAGEFVFAALCLVGFHHRLPDAVRWDVFRFPALFAGAFGLVRAFSRWFDVRRTPGNMPLGSMLGGAGDSNGDMDRLLEVYRWVDRDLVNAYLRIGYVCAAIVAVHYLFFLRRGIRAARA